MARIVSSGLLLGYALRKGNLVNKIHLALFLYFLADVLIFYYESPLLNTSAFILRITAYILLLLFIRKELRLVRMNLTQKIIFGVVLVLNISILVSLVGIVPLEKQFPGLNWLLYLYGIILIMLMLVPMVYQNRNLDTAASLFTGISFCLVFSDILFFIAYYLEMATFYYPTRVFYIIGLTGLVAMALSTKKESEKLV